MQLDALEKIRVDLKFLPVRVRHYEGDDESGRGSDEEHDTEVSSVDDSKDEDTTDDEKNDATWSVDEGDAIEEMYETALELMKNVPEDHSIWLDIVLQKDKPERDTHAIELVMKGEKPGKEDPADRIMGGGGAYRQKGRQKRKTTWRSKRLGGIYARGRGFGTLNTISTFGDEPGSEAGCL